MGPSCLTALLVETDKFILPVVLGATGRRLVGDGLCRVLTFTGILLLVVLAAIGVICLGGDGGC